MCNETLLTYVNESALIIIIFKLVKIRLRNLKRFGYLLYSHECVNQLKIFQNSLIGLAFF